jgi:hypothetical protein
MQKKSDPKDTAPKSTSKTPIPKKAADKKLKKITF